MRKQTLIGSIQVWGQISHFLQFQARIISLQARITHLLRSLQPSKPREHELERFRASPALKRPSNANSDIPSQVTPSHPITSIAFPSPCIAFQSSDLADRRLSAREARTRSSKRKSLLLPMLQVLDLLVCTYRFYSSLFLSFLSAFFPIHCQLATLISDDFRCFSN